MTSASTGGVIGSAGVVKVSCVLRQWVVQLISAYNWARPATLVTSKGRGWGCFILFLAFILVLPVPLLFSPFFWQTTQWPTRVDMSNRTQICICVEPPASVTRSDSRRLETGGHRFNPAEACSILSWRLIAKYFLRSFSPFRWFEKEGHLSVSGKRMCTIMVNRSELGQPAR